MRALWLILLISTAAAAQSHAVGYAGIVSRQHADRLDFETFRSGPVHTTTPALGAEAGTRIWKVLIDGSVLYSRTGLQEVFISPIRSLERTANGHVVMLEVGGGWRLAGFKGFDLAARAGYGTARVRVPTEVVIEADQRFWNYGLTGMRKIGSRYVLRLEIRNVQFRKDFVPQTLGRANIIALGGWGIRF